MLAISEDQRKYLALDGAPLPLIDPEAGRCYMLMPVNFTRSAEDRILARVPGVRAVGEAEQPTEALATLALLIKDTLERL